MVVCQHHCAGNHRIIHVPIIVRIVAQNNQAVGEFAGDIGLIPTTINYN
jgi:hypothetical protein